MSFRAALPRAALLLPSSSASARSSVRCSSSKVDPPDVKSIAKMAHIGVTEDEVKDWSPKIAGIIDWFGQLQQVHVEGVPPALRAAGQDLLEDSRLRADEAAEYPGRKEMLQGVPKLEGSLLSVPKILAADQE